MKQKVSFLVGIEEGAFMNEEKYTQKALSALQEAQNNALAENHQEIKEEHLLCALLADNGLIGG